MALPAQPVQEQRALFDRGAAQEQEVGDAGQLGAALLRRLAQAIVR